MLEINKQTKAFKKILKFYNIYDKDAKIDISSFNKPDEFLRTFTPNNTSNNPLPNNIRRNEDGRIILEDIPFILSNIYKKSQIAEIAFYKCIHSRNLPSWLILNNGSKILLKELDTIKIEQEILMMYLYRELNLPATDYDIATLAGEDHLISSSFLAPNETIYYPFDLTSKNNHNSYDIENLLSAVPESNKLLLLQTIFTDIIFGNWDRFPNNYALKKTKKSLINAPLFDNAEFCFQQSTKYFPCYNGINDHDYVINYLLGYSEILNWVKSYMTKPILDTAIDKMKQEKNLTISSKTHYNFDCFLTYSEAIINEELKDMGESFKIKLV